MALQMTTSHNGVSITDAYHKVMHVGGTKDMMEVRMGIFATSSESNPFTVVHFSMAPTMDAGAGDVNNIKQAYSHLKAGEVTMSNGMAIDLSTATDV